MFALVVNISAICVLENTGMIPNVINQTYLHDQEPTRTIIIKNPMEMKCAMVMIKNGSVLYNM